MDDLEVSNSFVQPGKFSLPPEAWSIVGQKIQSKNALKSLVGTCRTFRDIFTPFLFAHRVLHLDLCQYSELNHRALPSGLDHVKDLEVTLCEHASTVDYKHHMNDGFASFIGRILKEIPKLRSFQWRDESFETSYGPALILRNPELLGLLKNCQTLKSLSIEFSSLYLADRHAALNCSIPLKGFSNLRCLELYKLYGDSAQMTKDIAGVLCECPNLKIFGIGMACDTDPQYAREYEILIIEGDTEFLETLCVEYGSLRNATPLALDTLRLGHGMFLVMSPISDNVGNYLSKLVDVSALKQFHIYNGLIKFDGIDDIDDDGLESEVHWSMLDGCTSLHQLSVTRIESDVREFLNGGGKCVQELIITEQYANYDENLEEFDLLTPQLSMLVTWERFVLYHPSAVDGQRSPTVQKTVLDHLLHRGSQLTSLGICLDFEEQWEQFSHHLESLSLLTQLRLCNKILKGGIYPTKSSSLWPGISRSKDIVRRYAQLIKSKCRSLKLIRIAGWAWEISFKNGGMISPGMDIYIEIELRELDWDEMMTIELFSINTFVSGSGLLGPDEWHEEMTDEQSREF